MRIHCDFCGAEIDKDAAFTHELENGDVLHFCSEECLESLEYHETMQDPSDRDEAADVR